MKPPSSETYSQSRIRLQLTVGQLIQPLSFYVYLMTFSDWLPLTFVIEISPNSIDAYAYFYQQWNILTHDRRYYTHVHLNTK